MSELIRNVSKQLQVLKRHKHLISYACMMPFFSPASPTAQLFGIIVQKKQWQTWVDQRELLAFYF